MAKPRQPTNVLQLKGAFAHNPDRGRARKDEPIPEGDIGAPPDRLSDSEKAAWVELAAVMHKNVLCASDRVGFEMAARLFAKIIDRTANESDRREFRMYLGLFGLTPADRSRVAQRGKEKKNPFLE